MVGRNRGSGIKGLPDVGRDQAKAAGVYVLGGGIDESVPPALVSADGTVAEGGYPWAPRLDGGFTVLELPYEWEWIERVPKFKLFREAEGRVRSLSPIEFERLCSELPHHLADMARFSVATGLRQADVKGLEWQYVDLVLNHAWIPGSKHKNGRPHSVPLNETALAVLRRQVGKHPSRVFTFRGEPITQVNTKAWTKALKRAGIADFRWHDLRHTFATGIAQRQST